MPRAATRRAKAQKKNSAPKTSATPKATPVAKATTRRTRKTRAKKPPAPAKEEEVVEAPTPTPATPGGTKKTRQTPTRETVMATFDEIVTMVETEITRLRESDTKTKGSKFLRSLNKRIKTLRGHTGRVMKQKTKTPRKSNANSGFQKPVKISSELAKFAGWPEDELRSRVEVTKYICDYVAEHDLQNPEDRREIRPDAKLQKLLGYNPKKASAPLRYWTIQTCLKERNHFPKDE